MGLQSTATGKAAQVRRTGLVAMSLRLDFSQPKKGKLSDIPSRAGERDAVLCSILVQPEAGRHRCCSRAFWRGRDLMNLQKQNPAHPMAN